MSRDMLNSTKLIDILLIEDDPADVELTRRALKRGEVFNSLNVVQDGVEALRFLRREDEHHDKPRPDLILLDLNMPRMDGRETLQATKAEDDLRSIPVIVLTTSDSQRDVAESYKLQASCYIAKPVDLKQFTEVVMGIKNFWLGLVKYPNATE